MIVIYLSGNLLALYMAYKIIHHECESDFHTRVGMIIGMAFFSWIAVSLMLAHLKLHYKWEIRGYLESAIKERALLLE